MLAVMPRVGFYLVFDWGPDGVESFSVTKARECACGGNGFNECEHIQAVEQFLRSGGARAPEVMRKPMPLPFPTTCVVCGAATVVKTAYRCAPWCECVADPNHQWDRAEVREFLTGPHPCKVGGYYGYNPQSES